MSTVLEFIQNGGFKLSQESKFIVLYFTAHWCPPCKAFSPTFVESMKASGSDVEVFICSRDRDQNQYNEYMQSFQGFNIFPFQSEPVGAMMQQLGIRGIPSVQVFDKDGQLVTDDGRSVIMKNPKNFSASLQQEIEDSKKSVLDLLQFTTIQIPQEAKFVGLYFTASWCPPCKQFSPILQKIHQDISQTHQQQFQLIVLSCDEEQDGFEECTQKYKDKPNAHVLPFQDPVGEQLAQRLKIQSIPSLIILNAQNGSIVTKDGRAQIEQYKEKAIDQWK